MQQSEKSNNSRILELETAIRSQVLVQNTQIIIENMPLHFENVLRFFIYEGDNLIKKDPHINSRDLRLIINYCFKFLLRSKSSSANSVNVLKEAIKTSESCFFMAYTICYDFINKGNYENDLLKDLKEAGITEAELIELRKGMIDKIQNAADNGDLINIDQKIALLSEIMYIWSKLTKSVFGNIDKIKEWVKSVTSTEKELKIFLIEVLSHQDKVNLVYSSIIKEVEEYLDIDWNITNRDYYVKKIFSIIKDMSNKDPQKLLLEEFVKKCLK